MSCSVRPRVAFVTNGNYFANQVLAPVLTNTVGTWDHLVLLITGLRRPGNRYVEAGRLLRRWGWRYGSYKVATQLLPLVGERVQRRPLVVGTICKRLGLDQRKILSVNDGEGFEQLRAFAPDLLVSVSCPSRIERHVLELATIGSVNVHSSLLPRYAGVSTYIHVLAEGVPETGATIHEMVERFDAGRLLAQQAVAIESGTTAFGLFSDVCRTAAPLLQATLIETLATGRLTGQTQDLSQRSYRGEPGPDEIAALRRRGHRLLSVGDLATLLRPWEPVNARCHRDP